MKLTMIILFSTTMLVSASLYSQTTRLTLNFSDISYGELFLKIEEQSEFSFAYTGSNFDPNQKIEIDVTKGTLTEILNEVLPGNVTYEIIDRYVVIYNADEKNATASQQTKAVSGKVNDSSGAPLPGVTVVVKGTTQGTVTDGDGNYTLPNVPGDGVLVFSFVGMKTREIPVSGKTNINVTMEEEAIGIEEVVAIGYGTQKRRDVIGSISTIKSEDITSKRPFTLEGALQGQSSGLLITPSNGNPEAKLKVWIRGLSTISSDSDPLWVVDGTPTTDISNLNPYDIASVEVLKDAGATAIYGSRAANGVIIVTTKVAAPNKKRTNINYSTGLSQLSRTAEDMGIANTKEWFELLDIATTNAGMLKFDDDLTAITNFPLGNKKGYKPITRSEAEAINNSPDKFFRNGNYHDINLSSSLGFEKATMFFSLNYRSDKGVEKDNSLNRFSLRMNLDYEPVMNIKIGSKINLSTVQNNSGYNQFATVMGRRQTWYPIYDNADPTGYWNPYSGIASTEMRTSSEFVDISSQSYRILASNYIQYNVPFVKGLIVKANVNFDQSFYSSLYWQSAMIRDKGVTLDEENSNRSSNILYNTYLAYNRDFGDHNISFTGGAERQSYKMYEYRLAGEDLSSPFHELGYMPTYKNDMFAGISEGMNGERYIGSYFSRLGYRFKNKYMLEASLRQDGSSAFSKDKRYGLFTAVSAGWVMSDESFFKPLSKVVNTAKFRGSVGKTGNQQIPNGMMSLAWISPSGNWGGSDNQGTSGSFPDNVPNMDITWETTTSYDGGLDFGLFNNRISGSIAYYLRDVDGLLLALNIPASSGANSGTIWKNIGRMKTNGLEFDLRWLNIDKNGFRWSSTFNFTTSHNKITSLNPEIDDTGKGIAESDELHWAWSYLRVGGSVGEYFMPEEAGINSEHGYPEIWELDEAKYAETGETVSTGRKIPGTVSNLRNNKFIEKGKTGLPTYFGSFGNTLEYKGFDLNFLFMFMGGNYLYNDFNVAMTQPRIFWYPTSNKLLTEAWKNPGDIAKYPQVIYGSIWNFDDEGNPVNSGGSWGEDQSPSTRYLEKADFIRLKNLQIGYTLPKQISAKIGADNLRVYLAATNLLTFTGYTGWDPEITRIEGGNDALVNRRQNMLSGYAPTATPNYKTYSFGISLGF